MNFHNYYFIELKCEKNKITLLFLIFFALGRLWLGKVFSSNSILVIKQKKNYTLLMIFMLKLTMEEWFIFINFLNKKLSIFRNSMMEYCFLLIYLTLGMWQAIFLSGQISIQNSQESTYLKFQSGSLSLKQEKQVVVKKRKNLYNESSCRLYNRTK